ncbi:MAG: DUF4358 domain-containing protein [Oscillospiraceae bacterium]|nr:DUF4358 domain-containing protein [Oscillospiraceae bacterium]
MKNTKIIALFLCLIMTAAALTACGGGEVRNDVAVSELSAKINSELESGADLVDAPESYISSSMGFDLSSVSEYVVKINSRGVNIDEYGIFKAADDSQLQQLQTAVSNYLQFRVDTWMVEYMPEEFPKLQNAETKTIGNYVMYAILSDSDKQAVFSAFEKTLK